MKKGMNIRRIICYLLVICSIFTVTASGRIQADGAVSLTSMVKKLKKANPDGADTLNDNQRKYFKKAVEIAKKLPTYAEEKCVEYMSSEMKKAYKKKVNRYIEKCKKNNIDSESDILMIDYYLTDFDHDEKAELLIDYVRCTQI